MQYGAGANATSTARLLYLRADPAELLRANLISSVNDPCMDVSWLGAAYSIGEFANLLSIAGQVNRLITPLHATLRLRLSRRPSSQHFSTCATLWTPILLSLSAPHQSRRRTRDVLSRPNQSTASPIRPKAAERGEAVALPLALAPHKRRPKDQATHPMARMDAVVPRTGEDAGTGTTPATAGLSSDDA